MSKYGLIRYPGSKAKLWGPILNAMPEEISIPLWSENCKWDYREPFFGSGAIGFRLLDVIDTRCNVWLNDKDYSLVCMWKSVQDSPKELQDMVMQFKPNTEDFFIFKKEDGATDIDPVLSGFRKLALHQMSVSGFGAMSGTCLGGRDQENAQYPIDCRWNPITLCKHIESRHLQFKRFGRRLKITCEDFQELIEGAPRKCFLYADPPYVEKGGMLYKYSMSEDDHRRLAKLLIGSKCKWVASYDDHPLVREMYKRCDIEEVKVTYTNATNAISVRPKNKEVVIKSLFKGSR
jgi:DNA adenine methylase